MGTDIMTHTIDVYSLSLEAPGVQCSLLKRYLKNQVQKNLKDRAKYEFTGLGVLFQKLKRRFCPLRVSLQMFPDLVPFTIPQKSFSKLAKRKANALIRPETQVTKVLKSCCRVSPGQNQLGFFSQTSPTDDEIGKIHKLVIPPLGSLTLIHCLSGVAAFGGRGQP